MQIHGLPLDRQNEANLRRLGAILGNVKEVDMVSNGPVAGKRFVRVRVGIDVNSPLSTGFPLNRKDLPILWIPFKYEKLGNFCYGCGVMGHEVRVCPDPENQRLWAEQNTLGIFGNWLRAENNKFQPGIDLEGLRTSDMVECSKHTEVELVAVAETSKPPGNQVCGNKAYNLWTDAIQLALDSWTEVQQRAPMDQSESYVAETLEERNDKEARAAMGREESEKQARDLQLSCHLGFEEMLK